VFGNRAQQSSCSPFGIQNRITSPFAHDGKDVQWLRRGRVDHDLVLLAPPVELTWGLSVSYQILDR